MSSKRHNSSHPHSGPRSFDQTISDVAHLMRRAGFGASPADILTAAHAGLAPTIDALVKYDSVPDSFAPPGFGDMMDPKNRRIEPVTLWWLNRMLTTSRPLQEKMTLFWHNHFATAHYKVYRPDFMFNQNQIFRSMGMGRFDDLLSAVSKDPAMLIWLDGQRNTKYAPNENYGREVMELFTLGRGKYTEDDVHANARAFTGWRIDDKGNAVLVARNFDDGPKKLLGFTGNWGMDDAVRILSAHPATGPFLATKLWRFFASDQPPYTAIRKMSKAYYDSGHLIQPMVLAMFSSPDFYTDHTRTTHVKSPVDYVLTTIKQLGLQKVDLTPYPRLLAVLGQELFNPPNVGGWPGGANWINAGTMLSRFNFASRLTGDAPGSRAIVDPQTLLSDSRADTLSQLAYYVADTLGISMSSETERALLRYTGKGPVESGVDALTKIRGLIHLVLVSPEYQIA